MAFHFYSIDWIWICAFANIFHLLCVVYVQVAFFTLVQCFFVNKLKFSESWFIRQEIFYLKI